ncbi:unnamed protein product, partial [Thlaspi arvense]
RQNITFKFFWATRFFKDQLEKLLETPRPDCLIADMFFPWATEKFHVPRLVFHGTGYFPLCAEYCIRVHKPQKTVASSCEPFMIPDLPGKIVMTQEAIKDPTKKPRWGNSDLKSSGVIVNCFYELEPDYADFYKSVVAKRAWHIGPLSVINRGNVENAERGKKASIDEVECLKYLDSKKPDSVVYISFGSVACFKNEQLMEIAAGLEASGTSFIWVVRKNAGLPMVAWLVGAEQFYNEKLVTEVLRTGVSVGDEKHVRVMGDFISREKVDKAVREVLLGEEAEERKRRAKKLAEMAKAAVEEGGSSFNDISIFIEEFSS